MWHYQICLAASAVPENRGFPWLTTVLYRIVPVRNYGKIRGNYHTRLVPSVGQINSFSEMVREILGGRNTYNKGRAREWEPRRVLLLNNTASWWAQLQRVREHEHEDNSTPTYRMTRGREKRNIGSEFTINDPFHSTDFSCNLYFNADSIEPYQGIRYFCGIWSMNLFSHRLATLSKHQEIEL